jgi:hypothetical protein
VERFNRLRQYRSLATRYAITHTSFQAVRVAAMHHSRPYATPYGGLVDRTTHPLPERDLHALFAVLLAVHGALFVDELPEQIFAPLAARLVEDGLLPVGASKGEVNALLADLAQRTHWVMRQSPDQPYPEPLPREVTHDLTFPAGEAAARAFVADVVALGGRDVGVRPGQSGWTMRPDGAREPLDPPGTWLVGVTFSELPPDPDFHARAAQLDALATRHGGYYNGHHN